jgi:hypothetical protein
MSPDTLPPGSVSLSFIADEIHGAIDRIRSTETQLLAANQLTDRGREKIALAIETLETTAQDLQHTLCSGGVWRLEW